MNFARSKRIREIGGKIKQKNSVVKEFYMNESKTTQIKQIVAKIDIEKIMSYLQEYPSSSTLKEIIKYSKRVLDSNEEEAKVFRLGVKLAYNLDKICDSEKVGCVKDGTEKKYWLEISEELFKHTIGEKK